MCFFSQQTKTAQELKHRFQVEFENEESYFPSQYNGFQFPKTPIITNQKPTTIQMYHWGLIPAWSNDSAIRKYTLNP